MTRSGKSILITGCSSGIGRAIALELHASGARVFASARRLEALEGLPCEKLALDVTDPASIRAAVEQMTAGAGGIDVLVNNAGIHVAGPIAEMPLDDLRRMFETNVLGLTAMVQGVFPQMAAQGHGRIVNIGSIVHMFATPFGAAYAASKAAVNLLSEGMRMELAPFGIEVVEVQPGGVQSSLSDTAERGLTPYREATSRYRGAYDGILKRARASQEKPMPTEAFARELCSQILQARAPRVVRLGRGATSIPWLKRLPSTLLERALRQRFGLEKLRPGA